MQSISSKALLLSAFLSFSGIGGVKGQTFSDFVDRIGLNNLDVAVDMGSTGIGLQVGTMVTPWMQVRTGFDYMPYFEKDMSFTIQIGDHVESKFDPDGNRVETTFDRMAGYMKEITGLDVDDEVIMVGTPSFNNAKLIFDVFPIRNCGWYLSAGVYAGRKVIGHAVNRIEEMPSLMAVGIYNNMYEKTVNEEPIFMGVELPPALADKVIDAGRMGIHVGDYVSDGTSYVMEPNNESMVTADMKVNAFRPYVGTGYKGQFSERNEHLKFAVEGGVFFWGGVPKVYLHDGTELTQDLTNIMGQVDRYVQLVKKFPVFPVLNLSLVYSF
ncbi:MAG: hypothetical protein MJY79_02805 [Bacteroidaceae bacterium]|nr:hypothetical protein [Bacteroidaceae bacterium]